MNTKISRQLALFHIFSCSSIVEMKEITYLLNIIEKTSVKTITRDIKNLQDAGLMRINYSKKEKGYIHHDADNRCPFLSPSFTDNEAKNRNLIKLIRLATVMVSLRNHTELPWYDARSENQETCISWYKKKFPGASARTMWRDFAELKSIGYSIKFNPDDRCYSVDFPEGLEGLQSRLQYLYEGDRNLELS